MSWRATLDLKVDDIGAVARVTRRRHSGPLLIQRGFYPESAQAAASLSKPCHVYLIHPPGGVAGGDELLLDVEVTVGAHLLLTTPAAGKFYRRGTLGGSHVKQSLRVECAALEWLPQENIFYPDAVAEVATVVRLGAQASFLGWEVACLGLPANGLTLQEGQLRLKFELWLDERPVFIDHLRIEPASRVARWGLAGHPVLGTFVAFPATAEHLEAARGATESCGDLIAACTLVDGVLVCRGLGRRADRLRRIFIEVWKALRPSLVGRAAVPPRVWAT